MKQKEIDQILFWLELRLRAMNNRIPENITSDELLKNDDFKKLNLYVALSETIEKNTKEVIPLLEVLMNQTNNDIEEMVNMFDIKFSKVGDKIVHEVIIKDGDDDLIAET